MVTEQKGIEGKISEEGQGKRAIHLPGQKEGPTYTAGKEEPTYQGDRQACTGPASWSSEGTNPTDSWPGITGLHYGMVSQTPVSMPVNQFQ